VAHFDINKNNRNTFLVLLDRADSNWNHA